MSFEDSFGLKIPDGLAAKMTDPGGCHRLCRKPASPAAEDQIRPLIAEIVRLLTIQQPRHQTEKFTAKTPPSSAISEQVSVGCRGSCQLPLQPRRRRKPHSPADAAGLRGWREEERQAFADGTGIAGRLMKQAASARACRGARKDRGGHFGKGLHAHVSPKPGSSRSSTARVASGVTSRGAGPVRRWSARGRSARHRTTGAASPRSPRAVGDEHAHPFCRLPARASAHTRSISGPLWS